MSTKALETKKEETNITNRKRGSSCARWVKRRPQSFPSAAATSTETECWPSGEVQSSRKILLSVNAAKKESKAASISAAHETALSLHACPASDTSTQGPAGAAH